MPTVATIRSEVVKLLTTARLNVVMDGRTLDEVRNEIADPPSLGWRKNNRPEQYSSWFKYFAYMKQPDKYADTLFVLGLASFYNISVRIISNIHDAAQVYYLGFAAPTDVITLCFLQSVEHDYAIRELLPMSIEEPAILYAPVIPAAVHSVNTDSLEPNMHNERDLAAKIEHTFQEADIQNESFPDNGEQSDAIAQAQPLFSIPVSTWVRLHARKSRAV